MATPTPPGGGRVSRGSRTKVLAPKQHQILQQQQAAAIASQLAMPGSTSVMMQVPCIITAIALLDYGTGSTVYHTHMLKFHP